MTCFEVSGDVDMADALMYSCNGYFGRMALKIGKKMMTARAEMQGFNKNLSFDGIETASSSYNVSDADENEFAWSGVGQYKVLETPINMAVRSAAIANGGTPVMPRLIKSMNGIVSPLVNVGKTTLGDEMMSRKTAEKLSDMMDRTAREYYGKSYLCDKLDICAKTGTAEVGGGEKAHAWVTGFAKDEDCPIAFSVIVEHGDSSFYAAIPAASKVLDATADAFRARK